MYRNKKVFAVAVFSVMLLSACQKEEPVNKVVFTPDVENQTTKAVVENETVYTGEFEEFLPGEENWGEKVVATTAYVNETTGVGTLKEAVRNSLGDAFWPDTDIESLDNANITADMYEEFVYCVTADEDKADEIIIVKAKDDQVDKVFDRLSQYRDSKINDYNVNENDIIKIQCSQVVNAGNYVAFIQLGADLGQKAAGQKAAESMAAVSDDVLAQAEMDAIETQNKLAQESIFNALVK